MERGREMERPTIEAPCELTKPEGRYPKTIIAPVDIRLKSPCSSREQLPVRSAMGDSILAAHRLSLLTPDQAAEMDLEPLPTPTAQLPSFPYQLPGP